MAKHALRKILLSMGMLMLLCLFVASANATVKPGDVITPENAAQVKDLVSPGVYYAVTHGMHMDIVPDRADRLAAALQGGDRKVFLAGAALNTIIAAWSATSPASRFR